MAEPTQESLDKMWKYVKGYAEKSGTTMHPIPAVTEAVVKGLAMHMDELGKPLCPCNFYKDKQAEAKLRRWMCACDEMQIYKYCHCLLFVREDGLPITEYLPEGHEGREVYGIVTDPTPDKGRALKHKAAAGPIPSDETPRRPHLDLNDHAIAQPAFVRRSHRTSRRNPMVRQAWGCRAWQRASCQDRTTSNPERKRPTRLQAEGTRNSGRTSISCLPIREGYYSSRRPSPSPSHHPLHTSLVRP